MEKGGKQDQKIWSESWRQTRVWCPSLVSHIVIYLQDIAGEAGTFYFGPRHIDTPVIANQHKLPCRLGL